MPAVRSCARPGHQPALFATVDQFDHAVMVQLHPLRQRADGWDQLPGQAFDGQQELILLGVQAGISGLGLHVAQEPPQLITELRQRHVFSLIQWSVCFPL